MLPPLFHISFNNKLPLTLNPRQPDGSEIKEEITITTETDVPRVSFAPTVFNCLQAIYPNVSKFMESDRGLKEGCQFSVYRYDPRSKARVVTPDQLTSRRWVWDAHVTKEHCFLDPVRIYYCGNVIARLVDGNDPGIMTYPYGEEKAGVKKQYILSDVRLTKTLQLRGERYEIYLFGDPHVFDKK